MLERAKNIFTSFENLLLAGIFLLSYVLISAASHPKTKRKALQFFSKLVGFLKRSYVHFCIVGGGIIICIAFYLYISTLPIIATNILGRLLALSASENSSAQDVRNLAYSFGAIAAALTVFATLPFQLIKIWINERNATNSEQGLITDRISSAVEALGAIKSVSVLQKNEKGEPVYEKYKNNKPNFSKPVLIQESQPNLEVRLGGLLALERISQDSLRDHVQIMEIITAYIRENAPVQRITSSKLNELFEDGGMPEEPDAVSLRKYYVVLPKLRTDIKTALDIIGRRGPSQIAMEKRDIRHHEDGYFLNLSFSDLEGFVSIGQNFSRAVFVHSNLRHSDFIDTELSGSSFRIANLDNVSFLRSNLSYSVLSGANLGSNTIFRSSNLSCAMMWDMTLEETDISQVQIDSAFGDATVSLPKNLVRPQHWATVALKDQYRSEWYKYCRSKSFLRKYNPLSNYTPPKK